MSKVLNVTLKMLIKSVLALMCVHLLSSCGGDDTGSSQSNSDFIGRDDSQDDKVASEVCVAPEGLTLTDIESVTDWINALPKPTTLPCFLQSLPRPLTLNFTHSVVSAQPSLGAGRPRTFIIHGDLIFSVVLYHDDTRYDKGDKPVNLMELTHVSEKDDDYIGQLKGIKGEYKFPFEEEIGYNEPYEHLVSKSRMSTACAGCHGLEKQVGTIDGSPIFSSLVYKPMDDLVVSLTHMRYEESLCDAISDPFRCLMFSSIFDHGDVEELGFPEGSVFFR